MSVGGRVNLGEIFVVLAKLRQVSRPLLYVGEPDIVLPPQQSDNVLLGWIILGALQQLSIPRYI